ncbi:DUF3592 domain-containing protein, partial [Variovorax sp. YR216]|uniref:DUF3592 domain-containing protein n=1 Tax=Variovorax sp. YR216 TaxID=1882828 RepID=UPI001C40933D
REVHTILRRARSHDRLHTVRRIQEGLGRTLTFNRRAAFGTLACKHQRSEAESQASTRPIGSQVSVIYEPGNPRNAALEVMRDGGAFRWFLVASGGAFLLLGVAMLHPASWRGKKT